MRMATKAEKLQHLESALRDLCLKLGRQEVLNLGGLTADQHRQKLLTVTRNALRDLDEEKTNSSNAAMSMSTNEPLPDGQEQAAAALARRMGIMNW